MKIKNYSLVLFVWLCLFTTHTHSQNHLFKIESSSDWRLFKTTRLNLVATNVLPLLLYTLFVWQSHVPVLW